MFLTTHDEFYNSSAKTHHKMIKLTRKNYLINW